MTIGGIIMITEKEYLIGIEKYNKFLFFISIGIVFVISIFIVILMLVPIIGKNSDILETNITPFLFIIIVIILKIPYFIFAVLQAIEAFKESEKKDTSMYKVFSILSFIALPTISPIIIFFLLRSDLKKLDEK